MYVTLNDSNSWYDRSVIATDPDLDSDYYSVILI